jgi:hypothetical protein
MEGVAEEEKLTMFVKMLSEDPEGWNRWKKAQGNANVDLTGANLERFNLEGVDLSGAVLTKANLSFANLTRANLSGANLSHASLAHARMRGAVLAFSRLDGANLPFADLQGADLRGANLKAVFLEDANLRRANLSQAHLEKAMLAHASLRDATCENATFKGANLEAVDLDGANVNSVVYDARSEWGFVKEIGIRPRKLWRKRRDMMLNTTIRCRGVKALCTGSQSFRRFLLDQDYLEELNETRKGRIVFFFWWLLANCGRSVARWSFWSFILTIIFAVTFYVLGPAHFQTARLPWTFATAFYHSVVTFTTLGVGDVMPITTFGAMMVVVEVVTGYIMLGGLISIFSARLARRAG